MTATIQRVNAQRKNVRRLPPRALQLRQPAEVQRLAEQVLRAAKRTDTAQPEVLAHLLALTVARVHQLDRYLSRYGVAAKNGEVKPAARLFADLTAQALRLCERLGLLAAPADDLAGIVATLQRQSPQDGEAL